MNKKISIYKLIGLIKGGKGKTPKTIEYGLYQWFFDENIKDYKNKKGILLFENYLENALMHSLNDEIEIIEEEKEIEELDLGKVSPNGEYIISINDEKIQNKINELVRELNKIKKEGK